MMNKQLPLLVVVLIYSMTTVIGNCPDDNTNSSTISDQTGSPSPSQTQGKTTTALPSAADVMLSPEKTTTMLPSVTDVVWSPSPSPSPSPNLLKHNTSVSATHGIISLLYCII